MTHTVPSVVVLVEDEILIRMEISYALCDAGFRVIEARNADEALAILQCKAQMVDVLFTDINMPGSMDGLDLAKHTKQHWPWIALLIVSGRDSPPEADLPDETHFMAKPYELDCAVRCVGELAGVGD